MDLLCDFTLDGTPELLTEESPPGYCRLRDARSGAYHLPISFVQRDGGDTHGPACQLNLSQDVSIDFVPSIHSAKLSSPNDGGRDAFSWIERPRTCGWPTQQTLEQISKAGYHVVAAEHPAKDRGRYIDWRFSFSFAERALLNSCNVSQRKCYVLLKMFNSTCWKEFEFLKSYHLKNIILWACERKAQSEWTNETVGQCLLSLLDELASCVDKGQLQHYFFPENNLLACVTQEDCQELYKEISAVRQDPIRYLLIFTKEFCFLGGVLKENVSSLVQPAIEARHLEGQQKAQVFEEVGSSVAAAYLQESAFWLQFARRRASLANTTESLKIVEEFILHDWKIEGFSDIPHKFLQIASTNTNIFKHYHKLFENVRKMPDRKEVNIRDDKTKDADIESDVIFGGFSMMDAMIALFVPSLCFKDILDSLQWYLSQEEDFGSFDTLEDLAKSLVKAVHGYIPSLYDAHSAKDSLGETQHLGVLPEDAPMCMLKCQERMEKDLFTPFNIELDTSQEVLDIKTVKRNFRKWDVQPKQVFDMARMLEGKVGDKAPILFDRFLESLNEYAGQPEERIFFFMSKVCDIVSPWDAVACYIHYYTEEGANRDISFQLFDLIKNLYQGLPSVNTAALGFLKVIQKYWPEEATQKVTAHPLFYIVSQLEKSNLWHSFSRPSKPPVTDTVPSGEVEDMTVPVLTTRQDWIKLLRYTLYELEYQENTEIRIVVFCDIMMTLFSEYRITCEYQWDHPAENKSVVLMRYLVMFVIFSINPRTPPPQCLHQFLSVLAPNVDVPPTVSLWHVTAGLLIYSLERTAHAFLRCILSPALAHAHRSDCVGAGMEELPGPSGIMVLFYDLELYYGLSDIPRALEDYLKTQYPGKPTQAAIYCLLGDVYGSTTSLSIPLSFDDLVAALEVYNRKFMYVVERSAHLSFSFPHGTAVLGRHIPVALLHMSVDVAHAPMLEGILRTDSLQDPGVAFTENSNDPIEQRVINIINGHSEVYKLKSVPGNYSEDEKAVLHYLEKECPQFERKPSSCNYKIDIVTLMQMFKGRFCSVKQGMLTIFNALMPGAHPQSQAIIYMKKNEVKDTVTFAGLLTSLSHQLGWETSEPVQEEPENFCQFLVQCYPNVDPLEALRKVLVQRGPSCREDWNPPTRALWENLDNMLYELFPNVSKPEAAERFMSLWNSCLPAGRVVRVPGEDKYTALVLRLGRLLRESGKQRSTTHHLQLYFLQELDSNLQGYRDHLELQEYRDHIESQADQCSMWEAFDLLWEYLHDAYHPTVQEWGVALLLLLGDLYPGEGRDEATLHLVTHLNTMHQDPIDITTLQPPFDTLHAMLMSFG